MERSVLCIINQFQPVSHVSAKPVTDVPRMGDFFCRNVDVRLNYWLSKVQKKQLLRQQCTRRP